MDSLDCYEERENNYIMWNRSQPIEQDALQNNPGYPFIQTFLTLFLLFQIDLHLAVVSAN